MATIIGPVNGIAAGLPGGVSAALNVTAAQVIKATPGMLVRISVIAPGSGAALTLNDVADVGDAAAGNEIVSVAAANLSAGQLLGPYNWPCSTGITASSVPSDGQFSVSFT